MRRARILPTINAFWRVPAILLTTAALASLSVLLSVVDGTGRLQHWCARQWSRFILLVSRVQVEVEGMEHLTPEAGYVFAANHLSMFDHWAFLAKLPFQFRFVAKESLFRWPFLGWHLRRSGNIPVNRRHPRQTLQAFREVSDKIRQGMSFVIYPEGMRTWGEGVAPFKKGAFLLAQQSGASIVPVTIVGAHRRLPRGSVVIVPGRFQLILHPPIQYSEYRDWELDRLAEHVRGIILSRYQQVPE